VSRETSVVTSYDSRPTTPDFSWLIHRFDSVASTMDVASQFARLGARDRTAVISPEQTAGRGRSGRSWQAAAGSAVLATLILRPPVAAHRLSTLPLIAGVAVAEAIENIGGRRVRLKWPNDVWLDAHAGPAKVAGILVSSSLRGESVEHVLIGVGINVLGGADELPPGATSIQAATGVTVSPDEVFQSVLERVADAYAAFDAADGQPSLDGWRSRAALLGQLVTVEEAGRARTGTFVGLDEDGSLLIGEPGQQIHKIVAGDLVRGPRAAGQPEEPSSRSTIVPRSCRSEPCQGG
jgi:BirA family transcriptional regulator, biotin operon repressor / biotin---[acetyl-CoA-carboxylase] ligase